ncbi:Gfo/Idh/MocA family oxidoreductase [Nonomuraea sp. B10E15]|uniref:Gfo/Idh/MocA family protein n=1 Tax=Nonomuraea sp. B10E15 TaxID=3153560 RepID=UPI00325C5B88
MLVGFGAMARTRTLLPLLTDPATPARAVSVCCLEQGEIEFQKIVLPWFSERGLPPPRYTPTPADALTLSPAPAAAVINTPNAMHASQVEQCLDAGVHVFVDRPIMLHSDDLPRLVERAAQANLLLFTGVQRRLETHFQHAYESVARQCDFGDLDTIRCVLAVGERPSSWRARHALVGGGVVIGTGYHLLDFAAWVAASRGERFGARAAGQVRFSAEHWMSPDVDPEIESSALGWVRSEGGVTISFDLSFSAPVGSVFELVDLRDRSGSRISICRDQRMRSRNPGHITHQRADGSVVTKHYNGAKITLSDALLPGDAQESRPLSDFVGKCASGGSLAEEHPCSGKASVPTWELVGRIYDLAKWQRRNAHVPTNGVRAGTP